MEQTQIAEILRRHKAVGKLAKKLNVHRISVTRVISGRSTSKRIMDAALKLALKLLKSEKSE